VEVAVRCGRVARIERTDDRKCETTQCCGKQRCGGSLTAANEKVAAVEAGGSMIGGMMMGWVTVSWIRPGRKKIDPMTPLSCPIQINRSEVPLRSSRVEVEI
jgi:hypothetical protein